MLEKVDIPDDEICSNLTGNLKVRCHYRKFLMAVDFNLCSFYEIQLSSRKFRLDFR